MCEFTRLNARYRDARCEPCRSVMGANQPTTNAWLPEDGIVDEIAVDIAALGSRRVALTLIEARQAATLMRGRMIDNPVIAERLQITEGCLRAWISEGRI